MEVGRSGWWATLPRRDDIYPTFIWNLLSQFNQKVCYVAGKRLCNQKILINDIKPSCRTNVLILCSYGKFSSRLGGISAESSEISPRRAGSLLI